MSTWVLLALSVLFTAGCSQPGTQDGDTRPNFVVMIADDLGWADVGFHGSHIATPNLDRLAASGVQLDRYYVCPTCSPTRAAVLTGRPPSRFGILAPVGGPDQEHIPPSTMTLPRLLQQAGYTTAISGKWHLGGRPMQYGFSRSYGYFHGQVDPYTHHYKTGVQTWHRNDEYLDEEGHATDLITREALAFIREQANASAPFFLYVAYSVPHYPLDEPEPWLAPYRETIANESRRLVAASLTHMDDAVGQVIKALDETGHAENTLVVFMSDNGGQRSWTNNQAEYEGRYAPNDSLGNNLPLRGWKTNMYEGGVRVPALLYWPGTLQPHTVSQVLGSVDLYPTIAHLAGIPEPPEAQLEGINAWPAVAGNAPPQERTLYWRIPGGMAVRKGDWKLIHQGKSLDTGTDELFNVGADPLEETECGGAFPDKLAELRELLAQQLARD